MSADPTLSDDPRFLAWRAFLHAYSAITTQLERELDASCGLTMSQYEVLLRLRLAPDGHMRMNDLAASVLLSKSGVTRLIDRMVASGLIERQACESDRRVTWARITDEGRVLLRRAAPGHVEGIQRLWASHLDPEEADRFSAFLLRVFREAGGDDSTFLGTSQTSPAG